MTFNQGMHSVTIRVLASLDAPEKFHSHSCPFDGSAGYIIPRHQADSYMDEEWSNEAGGLDSQLASNIAET